MLIIASGDNMNNVYEILIKNSNKKILDDFDFRMWKNNTSKVNIIDKCPYCESENIIKYGIYKKIRDINAKTRAVEELLLVNFIMNLDILRNLKTSMKNILSF